VTGGHGTGYPRPAGYDRAGGPDQGSGYGPGPGGARAARAPRGRGTRQRGSDDAVPGREDFRLKPGRDPKPGRDAGTRAGGRRARGNPVNGRGQGAPGYDAPGALNGRGARSGQDGYSAANGYSGQNGQNGYGGRNGYGAANGRNGQNGYGGQSSYGGPDGYGGQNGHGAANGRSGPDGYGGSYGTATGVRERAIDRTGIRQRLAGQRSDPGYGGGNGPGGGGPGGGRPARRAKGSWWRHWSWRKVLGLAAAACALVMIAVVIGGVLLYQQTQIPNAISETALQQSSIVYFSNGKTQVGTFDSGTNRQLLTSAQIPQVLKQAVIAAEDRHFYAEGGISISGIARAAYDDVFGSGGLQGGSTITEQFAKNAYASIGTTRTVSTKLKEILVAIKLSHEESKDWILTNYLNTIFLGDDAYGVGAAAETYFGKPAIKLNIAQSAMLAAMINQPGFFDPTPGTPGFKPLVARWHYVLGNMVRDGAITQQQENVTDHHQDDASGFPKLAKGPRNSGWSGYRGYIMQTVELELENRYHYTKSQISTSGLKIVTTFSQPMMRALYQSVRENKQAMRNGGVPLPRFANIGALLEKPGTGAIVAMYGGPNYAKRQLNMATQSRNQVGSSFKPYVLATAVHQGMNVKTSILDGYSAICSPDDQFPMVPSVRVAGPASPCPTSPADGWYNFSSDEADGPVSVAQASALSLNTAYGDLIHRVGTQNVIDMAAKFGVNTANYPAGSGLQHMEGQSGIALGQASLTVEEQANTFAVLAAHGQYVTPHVISKITSPTGPVPLRVVRYPVLNPGEAADVDYALSFDTIYGTATNAAMADGRPIIGKTGTTNNAQSAFFIGAIPQYSLAVGIFTNKQTETLNGLGGQSQGGYGGTWPALIWHTFAEKEFAKLPIKQLPVPPFEGTKWVQAPPPPVQHHHKPVPNPTPTPNPTPSPTPSPSCSQVFGQPCPSPTPTPGGPGPGPTPTCTPGPGRQCHPGHGG
jgi:membrane peptidoglycan carboxypeptidase